MADTDITPAPEYDELAPDADSAAAPRKSGKAIASLVLGIISLIFFGIIVGAIAVVLGVMARKEIAADATLGGDGMALAGIITGAIGLVLAIVLIAVGATFV